MYCFSKHFSFFFRYKGTNDLVNRSDENAKHLIYDLNKVLNV